MYFFLSVDAVVVAFRWSFWFERNIEGDFVVNKAHALCGGTFSRAVQFKILPVGCLLLSPAPTCPRGPSLEVLALLVPKFLPRRAS